MRKIIVTTILFFGIFTTNSALWFFPEYETEIVKNWKILVEKMTKQSINSNEEYISKAKDLIDSWIVKNSKDKITLREFYMIMDRQPVAKDEIWLQESTLSDAKIESNFVSLATTWYYNRTNAKNYAITWALWRNPSYNFYTWLNDCTNFTSQVLEKWWLPYIVSWILWKYDVKNWYYVNTPNAIPSFTWGWANNFYSHAKYYTNKFSSATTFWELQIWDLIQIDWTKDWTIDHSMVITGKTWTSTSQIFVTYHTNDTLNKKLSELIAQNPNSTYIWWKVIY